MKIAGVGWWSAGGGWGGERREGGGGGGAGTQEMEKERKRGRDGSSSLRMHNGKKKGKWMNCTGNEICRLLFTHARNYHRPRKKKKKRISASSER